MKSSTSPARGAVVDFVVSERERERELWPKSWSVLSMRTGVGVGVDPAVPPSRGRQWAGAPRPERDSSLAARRSCARDSYLRSFHSLIAFRALL